MAGRISGVAVFYATAGGVLLWSGIKGQTIGQTIHAITSGSPQALSAKGAETVGTPTLVNTAPAASTANTPNTTATQTGLSSAPAPSGSEISWIDSLLTAIGAPKTAANEGSIQSWIGHESPWNDFPPDGGQYTNNPLNTTLVTGGSVGTVNSVGVQRYGTPSEGVNATASTLLSGPYNDIVMLLRSGKGIRGQTLQGLSTWSGGGYSSV